MKINELCVCVCVCVQARERHVASIQVCMTDGELQSEAEVCACVHVSETGRLKCGGRVSLLMSFSF